jgi:heme oxygenase (biliverdin-IX-beta and delta-forming)
MALPPNYMGLSGAGQPVPGSVLTSGAGKRRATTIWKSELDLGRLKRDTAADHDRVESLVPLMQPDLTEELYRSVLLRFYCFVHGWESWAAINVPHELRSLLLERQRSHLLEADLLYFGQQRPSLRYVFSGPRLPGNAAFLGAMYVIEGSTLGGQYIARHVEHTLGLSPGKGDAYFRGYGDRTGAMWREFQNTLEGVNDQETDVVIGAAKKMFSAFGEWMAHVEHTSSYKAELSGVN